jgi:hypothetical protein
MDLFKFITNYDRLNRVYSKLLNVSLLTRTKPKKQLDLSAPACSCRMNSFQLSFDPIRIHKWRTRVWHLRSAFRDFISDAFIIETHSKTTSYTDVWI